MTSGQKLVHYALNPYIQFGVKKLPSPTEFGTSQDFTPFLSVLDKLASREVTGNAARDLLTQSLSQYDETSQTILKRMLLKDLACGASATTFNKIYTDLVPTFSVMLADKYDGDKVKPNFPCIAQFKLDGQRVIAVVDKDVTYFSRSGKVASFCDGLFDKELMLIKEQLGHSFIFDGEVMARSYKETMNAKSSDNDEAKKNLRYNVFDYMPLKDWENQKYPEKQLDRLNRVNTIISMYSMKDKINAVEFEICENKDQLNKMFKRAIDLGYEGLIIKDPDSLYEWDRDRKSVV